MKPVLAEFDVVAAILKPPHPGIDKRLRGSAILDAAARLEIFAHSAGSIFAAPVIGLGRRQG